eukprot:1445166-Rhodomonas_salina.1
MPAPFLDTDTVSDSRLVAAMPLRSGHTDTEPVGIRRRRGDGVSRSGVAGPAHRPSSAHHRSRPRYHICPSARGRRFLVHAGLICMQCILHAQSCACPAAAAAAVACGCACALRV